MDIGLDRMLRAHTKVGDITVRALSDLDVRERDRVALEESRKEADRLRDEQSDGYGELIAPMLEMSEDEMRAAVVAFQGRQFWRDIEDELPFQYIPFPDEATLEERQEVLRKREAHEEEIRQERTEVIAKRLVAFNDKVQNWTLEVLKQEVMRRAVAAHSLAKYADVYQYMTLVLACLKNGKPLFKKWKDVPEMSSRALEKLFAAYREVDSVDPWELEGNC
jgi:hypothetical protein